jgi:uncharacterized protein (TIGR00266 family)
MEIKIEYRPSYALAVCHLDAGERIKAESGAMVSMSDNVSMTTESGGIGKGLKRALLGGESFFQNTFTAKDKPGEVTLAPTLPGDITHFPLDGELILQGNSYLASSPEIEQNVQSQGLKGLFSEGLFMLKLKGQGDLLFNSFGGIQEVEVDGEYIVDDGHVVAFEPSLTYKVKRVGGWVATLFSGEGLVNRFSGKGKLWLQSRNPQVFGKYIGSKLPPREA